MQPATDSVGLSFPVRPEAREAAYDYGLALSFRDLDPALRWCRRSRSSPRVPRSSRVSSWTHPPTVPTCTGGDLHNALRRIAPHVTDTRGFVYDWNGGGYLDELTVTDGRLSVLRRHTGFRDGPRARRDLLAERARQTPTTRPWPKQSPTRSVRPRTEHPIAFGRPGTSCCRIAS
ncbi:hypothetical protein [Dactylosporangium sp. NPDC050588]|uniref:hypothetical protein n=1 Tax=Dactylosporangium sp. NPDC050588 TaxID=3157211 RepID=UPI0033EAD820